MQHKTEIYEYATNMVHYTTVEDSVRMISCTVIKFPLPTTNSHWKIPFYAIFFAELDMSDELNIFPIFAEILDVRKQIVSNG